MSVGQYFQTNLSMGQNKPGLRICQAKGPSYISPQDLIIWFSMSWGHYILACVVPGQQEHRTHTPITPGRFCQSKLFMHIDSRTPARKPESSDLKSLLFLAFGVTWVLSQFQYSSCAGNLCMVVQMFNF